MHMLPVYYTTTNTRRRKKKKKTKALLAAEKEHEKFLYRIGIHDSKQKPRSVAQSGSAPALGAGGHRFKSYHSDHSFHPCVIKDESYKFTIDEIKKNTRRYAKRQITWNKKYRQGFLVNENYKLDVSDRYVVGQAYNKGGLQVLSKKEQSDPATGKRR